MTMAIQRSCLLAGEKVHAYRGSATVAPLCLFASLTGFKAEFASELRYVGHATLAWRERLGVGSPMLITVNTPSSGGVKHLGVSNRNIFRARRYEHHHHHFWPAKRFVVRHHEWTGHMCAHWIDLTLENPLWGCAAHIVALQAPRVPLHKLPRSS
mgnify:CR=1 FL=1